MFVSAYLKKFFFLLFMFLNMLQIYMMQFKQKRIHWGGFLNCFEKTHALGEAHAKKRNYQ